MSLLHGNFKRQIKKISNPENGDGESCPKSQVPKDFFEKKYTKEDFKPGPDFCKNLEEDERLDFLLRMKHNMTEYFDNTAYASPHGLTNYDYKSIGVNQQECLEKMKIKARRENYIYMNNHPEVDAMIELLLRKLFLDQPEDPVKYTAEFFCVQHSSFEDHKKAIDEERERIKRYRKSKSKEFYEPTPEPSSTIRKLNLGPLASLLEFTKPPESEIPEPTPEPEKKPPHKYCGCKDWKLKRKLKKDNPVIEVPPPKDENIDGEESPGGEEEETDEEGQEGEGEDNNETNAPIMLFI